jgi:hypothetical protein
MAALKAKYWVVSLNLRQGVSTLKGPIKIGTYNPNKLIMPGFLIIPEYLGIKLIINGKSDVFLQHKVRDTRDNGKTYSEPIPTILIIPETPWTSCVGMEFAGRWTRCDHTSRLSWYFSLIIELFAGLLFLIFVFFEFLGGRWNRSWDIGGIVIRSRVSRGRRFLALLLWL